MNELTITPIRETDPGHVITLVNQVAGACKAIVGASCMQIQGRNYIKVEGWQAIAAAHGCTASADSVTTLEGGIAAMATIRRLTDGAILGQAEGFVGDDETMWAKRPLYARRAMAQTRAISRACRSAFAHVVVAMNAGHGTNYSTTPAEEVPADGFSDRQPAPERDAHQKAKSYTVEPQPEAQPSPSAWNAEQRTEAARIAKEIEAAGGGVDLAKIRARAKGVPAAEVLDAMASLLLRCEQVVVEGIAS